MWASGHDVFATLKALHQGYCLCPCSADSLCPVYQADSEESASNGPGSETDSQQSEQTRARHVRKDSAKSMESRLAKPLTEQDLQRASTKSSSSIGMDRIPQRPSLLGSALQQVPYPHDPQPLAKKLFPCSGRRL